MGPHFHWNKIPFRYPTIEKETANANTIFDLLKSVLFSAFVVELNVTKTYPIPIRMCIFSLHLF